MTTVLFNGLPYMLMDNEVFTWEEVGLVIMMGEKTLYKLVYMVHLLSVSVQV